MCDLMAADAPAPVVAVHSADVGPVGPGSVNVRTVALGRVNDNWGTQHVTVAPNHDASRTVAGTPSTATPSPTTSPNRSGTEILSRGDAGSDGRGEDEPGRHLFDVGCGAKLRGRLLWTTREDRTASPSEAVSLRTLPTAATMLMHLFGDLACLLKSPRRPSLWTDGSGVAADVHTRHLHT